MDVGLSINPFISNSDTSNKINLFWDTFFNQNKVITIHTVEI